MAGLGSLTIDLAANISRFEKSLNRAEKLADSRAKGIKRIFTRLAGGLGAALAGAGFVRAVDQALDYADAIGKTADKLGIATDSLQEYRFAAEQTGVQQKALDIGIQRFNRRLGEAQTGAGVLKDVFKDLNINLKDSNGQFKDSETILGEYADAIKDTTNEQQQLLLAFKAFDTEGVALVNLMRQGAEGINGFRQEARDLGIVLDEELIRNAEDATDQLGIMSQVLKVSLTEAAVGLAPAITEVGTALANLTKGDIQKLPEWAKNTAVVWKLLDEAFERTGISIAFAVTALQSIGDPSISTSIVWELYKQDLDEAGKATDDFIDKITGLTDLRVAVSRIGIGDTGAQIVEQIEAMAALVEAKRAEMQESIAQGAGDPGSMMFGILPSPDALQSQIDALLEKIAGYEEALGEFNLRQMSVGGGEGAGLNTITGQTADEMVAHLAAYEATLAEAAKAHEKIESDKARFAINQEKMVQTFVANSKQAAVNDAVGLLQILGRENKNYALAAIALQKGIAIAEAIINTEVAYTAALKYNPAYAASVAALGYARVGIIAATGIAEASAVNRAAGGGVSPTGSVVDPVSTIDASLTSDAQAGTTGTITINVNGVVTEEIMQDLIVPAIQDAVNDKDVVLFRSDSRQALELQ